MPRLDENGRPHWTYVVWCLFWGALFLIGAGMTVRWMRTNLDRSTSTIVCLLGIIACLLIGIWIDSRSRSRGREEGPDA